LQKIATGVERVIWLWMAKNGGEMVIPVSSNEIQRMLRITRTGEAEFDQTFYDIFSFVPMLAGKNGQGFLFLYVAGLFFLFF